MEQSSGEDPAFKYRPDSSSESPSDSDENPAKRPSLDVPSEPSKGPSASSEPSKGPSGPSVPKND